MHVLVPSFWIFRNNAATMKGHTIIYGHNMQDGSMFGNLLKYYTSGNDNYLKEHPFLYTYAENGVGIWQIFPYMRRQRMSIISRRIFNRRMHIIILLKICKTNLRLKRMSC